MLVTFRQALQFRKSTEQRQKMTTHRISVLKKGAKTPFLQIGLIFYLAFKAMAGWLASCLSFMVSARLSCSSITSACSNNLKQNST